MFCGTFWTIECFADYFHVYSGLSSWNARIGTPNYYLTLQSGKCYFCRSLEVCRLVQGRIQWAGSCLSPVASFLLHCSWPKASNWYDIILGVAGTFFLFFFSPPQEIYTKLFSLSKTQKKETWLCFAYSRGMSGCCWWVKYCPPIHFLPRRCLLKQCTFQSSLL